jgi:hypothetical protein
MGNVSVYPVYVIPGRELKLASGMTDRTVQSHNTGAAGPGRRAGPTTMRREQESPPIWGNAGRQKCAPRASAGRPAMHSDSGRNSCWAKDLCDFRSLWREPAISPQCPHNVPTCAPSARVPIKRRWIKPLGLLLASQQLACQVESGRFARRRQAASPCRAAQRGLRELGVMGFKYTRPAQAGLWAGR